ncbi:hypothetical protein YPPY34_4766, partial [Yersinia pestis PY-34]
MPGSKPQDDSAGARSEAPWGWDW